MQQPGMRQGRMHTTVNIPAAQVRAPIVRGVSAASLSQGAGHYPGTAWPGQPGTVGLAGHDVTYVPSAEGGHVFGRLADIYNAGGSVIGRKVIIHFHGRTYAYRITKQKTVPPTDYSILHGPKYGQRLVLTTCYPPHSAARRLVTIAWRIFPRRNR